MGTNHTHKPRPVALAPPPPPPPPLPGSVLVARTVEDLVEEMERDLLAHSLNCVREFGDFHIALSGGETPVPFYRTLMTDPICRGIPWRRTHLWLVDESFSDDETGEATRGHNWSMIGEFFVDHAGIPPAQLHPVESPFHRAADEYEEILRATLEWRERGHDRLDYVLLGVDVFGATAGLIPRCDAVTTHDRLITPTYSNQHVDQPPRRVTMTYPILNAARFIACMVTGETKRQAVRRISKLHSAHTGSEPAEGFEDQVSLIDFPIRGIRPLAGTLKWYLDQAASQID